MSLRAPFRHYRGRFSISRGSMAHATLTAVLRHVRSLLDERQSSASDAQLLDRFIRQREEAAFVALMHRYGPLVIGVARRVLRHEQDAEDAFQATFLILARKARSVRKRGSVGSWLYGVAYRLALKARAASARGKVRSEEHT